MNPNPRSTRGSSQIPAVNDYKSGGTGIVTCGSIAGNIKQTGNDELGIWSFQIFDTQKKIDLMIISNIPVLCKPNKQIWNSHIPPITNHAA